VPKEKKTTKKSSKKVNKRLPDDMLKAMSRASLEDESSTLMRMANSAISQSKEIVLRITDYFDAPLVDAKPYFQWYYNNQQQVITAANSATPYCALREAWIYAMAKFNVDTTQSLVGVMTSVPALTSVSADTYCAADPQMTILTPTSVSKWVCVGHYKANKLFAGELFPQVGPKGQQCVFAGCVVEPDTYTAVVTKNVLQFKVVIKVACGLDTFTNFEYGVDSAADVSGMSDATVFPTLTAQRAAIECLGMSNIA
jgi:hypothetical protein